MKEVVARLWRTLFPLDLSPSIILISFANTIVQTALQASLYTVENKSYTELQALCAAEGPSILEMSSRGRQENIVLLILHIWTFIIIMITFLRPSAIQIPFLFIILGLSVALGFAQYVDSIHIFRSCPGCGSASCGDLPLTQGLWLYTARLVLSVIFFAYYLILLWKFQRKALQKGILWRASTWCTLLLGIEILILSLKTDSGRITTRKSFSSWPFFYIIIAFSIVSPLVSLLLAIMRQRPIDSITVSVSRQNHSSVSLSTRTLKSLPQIPSADVELAVQSVANESNSAHDAMRPVSFGSTKRSSTIQDTESTYPQSKRSSRIQPVRSSMATKSFHTPAGSFRSSHDGDQSQMEGSLPFPSTGARSSRPETPSLHLDIPPSRSSPPPSSNSTPDTVAATSPPAIDISIPSSAIDFSTPPSAYIPIQSGPPPIYPPRDRRDTLGTLGSERTYETLPSYHSRRSTQTLPDMIGTPSTPRFVRLLPPLPPLPAFVSMESLLPSHLTSSSDPLQAGADDEHGDAGGSSDRGGL
ncbi:hypothetical protein VNI00_009934 [Paramarasmius palmivorus]|uniref:Uncharacterized protein n=1 Tax=Paramarasmius palmivorus TaxID=297713 RepID=A0AAW0CNK5_9AGAR